MYIKLDTFQAAVAQANQDTFDTFNCKPGPYRIDSPEGRFWQRQLDLYLAIYGSARRAAYALPRSGA